jgi:alkyldihydroxyacetonephosphate synthase
MTRRPEAAGPAEPAKPADMPWYGWGEPEHRHGLSARMRGLLAEECGLDERHTPPVEPGEVRMRPPGLPEDARRDLAAAVGEGHVRTDRETRLQHAGGKSYLDLLRRRRGDAANAPDAVVLPGTHEEVVAVLRGCTRHRVAVVPFGGGTSVVGGVEPDRGPFPAVIALDLRRLNRVTAVDTRALTARLEAGLRGPEAEARLAGHGLTLGHFPQSYARASIGGYAATRSAGQASSGYGRFDEMVLALRVATPEGTVEAGRIPASAAGPDLRALFLGSEGVLGVITEVTVRVRPRPELRRYEAWSFPSFSAGVEAVRRLVQGGAAPDVIRLSDPDETRVSLALAGGTASLLLRYLAVRGHRHGCLLVLGWEDTGTRVPARRAEAVRVLRGAGGLRLGRRAGEAWERGRFDGPYLRDDLLDAGALVETLETATSWSGLEALHAAVVEALRGALTEPGRSPVVMCHLSHAYPSGASLYFTVVGARRTDDGTGYGNGTLPEDEQWLAAKRAASDVIAARQATITHHHAVGRDHRPWLTAEIGELGLEALRAVKGRLDPAGILNPGKLLP